MSRVYFIKSVEGDSDDTLAGKLHDFLLKENVLDFINEKDMVPIKTHFGESPVSGFPRPVFLKRLGEIVRDRKAQPFMTETSTLYKGNRDNAAIHTEHALAQGFNYENTGMSIVMADGLFGDEEIEVKVEGKLYDSVKISSLFAKSQSLIVLSHFTGHVLAGFGAALKNLGMGCASRKGKMIQHSTAKPSVKHKKCTSCGQCLKWCPADAIKMTDEGALIDQEKCIGCGECLAVCRFDAVKYNWGTTYDELQKKITEHALGAYNLHRNSSIYINVLTRISKDCDCMAVYENICPDIGVVISRDPVAADAASIDLVEKVMGNKLSESSHDIPYRVQIDYAKEIGFGNTEYELVEV